MKTATVFKIAFLVSIVLAVCFNAQAGTNHSCSFDSHLFRGDNISVDYDDNNTIILECVEEDGIVEITQNYQLFIDGEKIKLNRNQRKLVKKYHSDFEDIMDLAQEIGTKGARLGAKGAKLGVYAVASVAKLLSEDYDSDDMQKDIERRANKIQKEADKLDKLSDKIEDIAHDLKRTHKKLRNNIDELDDLGWF